MRAIALTYSGLEPVVLQDLQEILHVSGIISSPGRVLYEASEDDIAKFTYFCRSISCSYVLFGSCSASLSSLQEAVSQITLPRMDVPFRVRCLRSGTHPFSSVEVEQFLGGYLAKAYSASVDLENPQTIVLVDIVDDVCYFGLDFSFVSLQKREWRVKTLSHSLNACLVYSALRLAGYSGKGVVFDPFVGDGAVLIEAALFSRGQPSAFRFEKELQCFKFLTLPSVPSRLPKGEFIGFDPQLGHIRAVQINGKIAGVDTFLSLSRQDVSWIDLKVPEKSVHCVVTHPLFPALHMKPSVGFRFYEELLSRLSFVLAPRGMICLICDHPALCRDALEKSDLLLSSAQNVVVGKSTFTLLFLSKQ